MVFLQLTKKFLGYHHIWRFIRARHWIASPSFGSSLHPHVLCLSSPSSSLYLDPLPPPTPTASSFQVSDWTSVLISDAPRAYCVLPNNVWGTVQIKLILTELRPPSLQFVCLKPWEHIDDRGNARYQTDWY
jgi:hypothetical protein